MIARVSKAAVTPALCVAILIASPTRAEAVPAPQTPKSRLLDVWLDLRLMAIFYPDTTSKTFVANLKKISSQLNQRLSPVRLADTAHDVLRFKVGTVVIMRRPPPDTWILYSRSRSQAWELIDDPVGHLRIRLVRVR